MFFSKFNDVATMSWIPAVKCTEIHSFDPNSIYGDYNIATFGGDSINSAASIMLNGGTYTHSAPTTIPINGNAMTRVGTTQFLVEMFLVSPDNVKSQYYRYAGTNDANAADDLTNLELKFSFSATCSVWSRPTQQVMNNKMGASGFTISEDVVDFTQTRFVENHCQNWVFTYTASQWDQNVITPTYPALDSTWQAFIPSTVTYQFSPKANNLVGTYSIVMKGTLTADAGL